MSGTVADYILARLRGWDVHRIYGYPGDGINALLGALDRAGGDPELIQVRHEEMAAFMADFFTRHPDLGTAGQPISALTPEGRQAVFVELGPWRKGRVDAWNRAAIAEFTAAAAVPVAI